MIIELTMLVASMFIAGYFAKISETDKGAIVTFVIFFLYGVYFWIKLGCGEK